jgi:predicted flap endonuclease-1-like 5' DNA nuclease
MEVVLGRVVRRLLILAMLTVAIVALARLLRSSRPGPAADRSDGSDGPPDGGHSDDRDLTLVKGIGPVYRERLAGAGIVSPADLCRADPAQVAAVAGVPESRARNWITQATALGRH